MAQVMEETHHLLVAPKCLQNRVLDFIEEEIHHADNNEPAYIGVKMNSLTDKTIIDKMVEASQHGVKIDLVVRGICCLIPGIEGYTENIRVISIVGRYLEHSRIYIFGTPERDKMFISSADFMTRNMVKRVEVATPIYDTAIKDRVRTMFGIMLHDTVKGRELCRDGNYYRREKEKVPLGEVQQIQNTASQEVLEGILKEEKNRLLYQAMNELEERKREILLMQYFGGLSQKEIAAILKMTPENVRVLSYRAKRELRTYMEDHNYDLS